MRLLKEILANINIEETIGDTNVYIEKISADTRDDLLNSLFIAVKGTTTDGHKYIPTAIEKRCKCVVCEEIPQSIDNEVVYIKVKDSSLALGQIASNWYDNPSEKLYLVGITGTNGKTTTVTLLYKVFKDLGYKVGLISTIENKIDERVIASSHTTPDAIQLNGLLAEMVSNRCQYVFMEVSSHAVVQNRIAGVRFTGGVFTNLTHDHLDYHKTFAEYLKAKKRFFDNLPKTAFALSNIDDKNGKIITQNTKAAVSYYGLMNPAEFKCKIIESTIEGTLMNINGVEAWFRLVGRFNAYNLLCVYAIGILLGQNQENMLVTLSKQTSVEGRFDYYKSAKGIVAIVDYAHTPDALENVLDTINEVRDKTKKLITVVGCGGDRDKTKRPEMAEIASEKSDKAIFTSDNPRTEKPEDILEDMQKGVSAKNKSKTLTIVNRKEAIGAAVMIAQQGDIILVAGKGHEKYQEINKVKYPFNDKEVLENLLNN